MCADDRQGAFHKFIVAANSRSELGRPSEKREHAFKLAKTEETGMQALNLATWYRKKKDQIVIAIKQVETDLVYGHNTNKAEEACQVLGRLLGLQGKRPGKAKDTGPDVTWEGHDELLAFGFELKTDKNKDGEYSKKNITQCHDHAEWLSNNYNGKTALTIVGPALPVSKKANPSGALQIIEIDSMRDLLARAKSMFEAVEAGDKANLEEVFQTWLNYYGLTWPACVESLHSMLAVDLKTD